jgi:hypothetical protein
VLPPLPPLLNDERLTKLPLGLVLGRGWLPVIFTLTLIL